MDKKLYDNMEKKYKEEIEILHLLSLCPDGLTEIDIISLIRNDKD